MNSERSSYGRHPAPGMWPKLPGSPAFGRPDQAPGADAPPAGRVHEPALDADGPPYAWRGPQPAGAAGEAAPEALHEYLLFLGGGAGAETTTPPVPSNAGPDAPPPGRRPQAVGPSAPDSSPLQSPTSAQGDALIASSSLGTPGVVDIAARTSENDVADVMQRMRALQQPSIEPPAEYAFERWIEESHDLPHTLMRTGRSYARQHFNHRAELCFRAALVAGHPDAENALASLPRTYKSPVEAGSDPEHPPRGLSETQAPITPHNTHLPDQGTPTGHGDPSGFPAQPPQALGCVRNMQAI